MTRYLMILISVMAMFRISAQTMVYYSNVDMAALTASDNTSCGKLLNPEYFYWLYPKYKNAVKGGNVTAPGRLFGKELEYANIHPQLKSAVEIDSVLVQRGRSEMEDWLDAKVDVTINLYSQSLDAAMSQFNKYYDQLVVLKAPKITLDKYSDFMEEIEVTKDIIHSTYCPNSERQRQYEMLLGRIKKTEMELRRYLIYLSGCEIAKANSTDETTTFYTRKSRHLQNAVTSAQLNWTTSAYESTTSIQRNRAPKSRK